MAQINITPLIDVMLVLLILFMVITPIAPQTLTATMPQPGPTGGTDHPLVLTVDASGYALNRTPAASLDEVADRLRDAFRAGAARIVFVQVLGDPTYGRVVEALDRATGAGAERLGFLPDQRLAHDALRP